MNPVLTKSKYILRLECPRHLWIIFNQPEEEKKKIRDNLLKYCELDTLAEVMIVEKLGELIK